MTAFPKVYLLFFDPPWRLLNWLLKEHISITAQEGDAIIGHCRPEQKFDFEAEKPEAPRWVLLCITEILHSYKSVNVS